MTNGPVLEIRSILCALMVSVFVWVETSVAYTLLDTATLGQNAVLKRENGPYLAPEDVIVPKNANLTIEPGCELRFAKGKHLVVHGTLYARGTRDSRIRFTQFTQQDLGLFNHSQIITHREANVAGRSESFRLVEGETMFDGKLQVFFNSKWHYVCSTQFNWTEVDVNVTCKSLGFSNGTFYYYSPSNNLTSHMKMFMPRCSGRENSLFDCPGTVDPELGLTVCDKQNVVGLVCEGFDNDAVLDYNNWGGIVFEKYAPYIRTQEHTSVFYNLSRSVLEYVDVQYAGLSRNKNRFRPQYDYMPGSAITVFQYAPRFDNILVEYSIGNGLNYSNIEAPAFISNSVFRHNRGHGISAKTRFGNVNIVNTVSQANRGDGLKYLYNNTAWSVQEQEEYITNRYLDYCDSQNPLSFPAYYKFRNPNYVRECSKTFTADPEMRITLHFQKINIISKYSTYWLEVYDGQTEKNSLIANYTFENGKTPEAIFSRSNYLFVKIKFQCNYPTERKLQPIELKQMELEKNWKIFSSQQAAYEQSRYDHNLPPGNYHEMRAERPWQDNPFKNVPPLFLDRLTHQEQVKQQTLYDRVQKEQDMLFNNEIQMKQLDSERTRISCPYSAYDEITMFAMIGTLKHADLLVRASHFVNNSLNGVNATNLHSLVQFNESSLAHNHMNGLHVQAGAGDVSFYHSSVESNSMNGVNITYAGGLKEFNYTRIYNNGLYGVYIDYNVTQEFDNIFQNTTFNGSLVEANVYGGVFIGAYCNQSNITVNGTIFRSNQEDGLVIEACKSAEAVDWYHLDPYERNLAKFDQRFSLRRRQIRFTHLNVSWNEFDSNRLNGLKIVSVKNMIGVITNNSFSGHRKGALLITPSDLSVPDNLVRNVSINITHNLFYNNSGRYALNVAVNELADWRVQSINITFNRFEMNRIDDPYRGLLNSRTSACAVAVVSSSNVGINQNWFDNPQSALQIATQLENYTSRINASYNWFNRLKPVYDLNYFLSYQDKCNEQWPLVRAGIFDNSNRSNLAQVVFWPFACNERLWWHESSRNIRPPAEFDMRATDNFGGVYDIHDSSLPPTRYTVTNDILIKPGAKLTIRSGTELNFLNGVGMLVLGELIVDGHLSSLVKFSLAGGQNFVPAPKTYVQRSFVDLINTTTSTTPAPMTNSTSNLTIQVETPRLEPIIVPTFTVSLVDGSNAYEGRLKVEINGVSGTVCNRGWTIQNSKVACHQMGMILDPTMYIYSRWLTNDPRLYEPILMSEVQCDTLDTILFECRHTRRYDHTCTHQDDVWIRCLQPGWAGVRFGLNAQPSRIKYALFERAGQYDFTRASLAPALQIDLMHHELSNLTFQHNQHTSLEILFNEPFKHTTLNSLTFVSNRGSGLLTRTPFLRVNQLYGLNNNFFHQPVIEYNPYFSAELLSYVRLYSIEPRRSYDVRRELTRLQDQTWFIGAEERILLYTDTEYNFGQQEFNVQIKTDNNRVLVVDLLDYNPNTHQEKVILCERLCQQSFSDLKSREWNMSDPSNIIFFPINTSYSVLHINYNVTSFKSGRLTLLVYSVKAPEPVYDYHNPSYFYIRNLMPDNVLKIHNSTFVQNRHSIILRQYEDTLDVLGSIRRRSNYTNVIISNCTFHSNDQVFWLNSDPMLPNIHQRVSNLSVHVANSLFESNKDDVLISESGYEMFELVPRVKLGPIGKVNVTFEECIFANNFGGIRALYRYYEYANTVWHFEIRNNRFVDNKQGCLRLLLPRLYRFAIKNNWENTTHSVNIRNNEFVSNSLFEMSIDGYYAQVNITKNLFIENKCRIGMVKFAGTEKDFFIYSNQIERNEANYLFDLEASSHADNDLDITSLIVENAIRKNFKPTGAIMARHRDAAQLFVSNAPSSYAIAIRGVQNCTINKNELENEAFDFELVGAMTTNTLNSTIDATQNWWGTYDPNLIAHRIFDLHEWNNHALVKFVPFISNKIDYSLSKLPPTMNVFQHQEFNIIGGIVFEDVTLADTSRPYQVRSDLTIMPGATLYINPGVELEFYPNVGLLVLGDLKASGTPSNYIKMRPIRRATNRMPFFSSFPNESVSYMDMPYYNFNYRDSSYLNSSRRLRFFDGLNHNEGFLQIYNATLRSWTMVCDHQFTLTTARIVCNQMGMEYRNSYARSLYYYFAPNTQQPIWNQTFICRGGEQTLAECDTFANYHMDECRAKSQYVYVMCKPYTLDKEGYDEPWGGVRFAQPYFEIYNSQSDVPNTPFIIKPDLQSQLQDSSYMYYVDVVGAGRLHNEPSPSVQLVYRTPFVSNCNIRHSAYHGLEFVQSKMTVMFNKLKIDSSLGYGVNSVQLNVQTTDQRSSFKVLLKNTLSGENIFSLVDLCDPHKYYDLEQRVIVYYRYSSQARDCIKIFRTRLSTTNLGGSSQIGLRFLQFQLVNSTITNDTVEIYNGTLFRQEYLLKQFNNGSHADDLESFYLSRTNSLSLFMRAGVGAEYYGFIAEVLIYPTAQYLLTDTYIELSDSELTKNQLGALSFASAGERNPHLYLVRNRLVENGFEYFNSTTMPTCDVVLQNAPKFYFGNNYVAENYGGVTLQVHSGSGVLITSSVVYNNLFYQNRNDTVLCTKGGLHLPYNEMGIDKNVFIENHSPRTDLIHVSGLLSKFTRNQIVYNKAARILFTQGFENVSTPRSQDISFNLFRDNFAYGIINELEDPNRFRSTMVAASLKQIYFANYLFNKDNDFELTSLVDPMSLAFLASVHTTSTAAPYLLQEMVPSQRFLDYDVFDDDSYLRWTTTRTYDWNKVAGLFAQNAAINASYNYWGTVVDSEIRARVRDKYDNATLFEVAYFPSVPDQYKLRDGKCELGWTLIDDTCYTYVGSYVTYREAEHVCRKFESRMARETVAPIKLPRFRKLARTSQFEYEVQSYRRMWLYSDAVIGQDLNSASSKCPVIEDYGADSVGCLEKLPFICEKDPVFLGATFKFKDEIAFAIAAVAALLVCIVLLSLLWLYKSKKRKKEHIDRQNTLRTSARTHRHMMNSTLNSLNKSSSVLYGTGSNGFLGSNYGNQSVDSLAATGTTGGISRAGRSLYGQIYNSQRNQYFANRKNKKPGEAGGPDEDNIAETQSNHSQSYQAAAANAGGFVSSGLDRVNFYGENDKPPANEPNEFAKSNPSVQYHILDAANSTATRKSSLKYNYDQDDDDTSDTDEATATTKSNRDRFNFKAGEHSPGESSNKTTITDYTDNNEVVEKQFIQARLIKTTTATATTPNAPISPPPKQSTPNLENKLNQAKQRTNYNPMTFTSSYDKLMNTTLTTTDTDDDQDANSKRLLTNKVNTSNLTPVKSKIPPNQYTQMPSFQSYNRPPSTFISHNNNDSVNNQNSFNCPSILSNATTNMTNVTPLGNVSLQQGNMNGAVQQQSSDYENLSNSAINDILDNYPRHNATPAVANRKNAGLNNNNTGSQNHLLQVAPTNRPRLVMPAPPPVPPPKNYMADNDDADSMMSCQLITSASLLVNRDTIKEARHITSEPAVAVPSLRKMPILNPRHLMPVHYEQPPHHKSQDAVVQHTHTDVDATKPPPMETAI